MKYVVLGLCLLFVVCSHPAQAAEPKTPITIDLTASLVIQHKNGTELLKQADEAQPGDRIQYEATYRNTGSFEVQNLLATIPVPDGLSYVPASANPAPRNASLDGSTFEAIPLTREVTNPDGTKKTQEVPRSEYRFLQWKQDTLGPGETAVFALRATVDQRQP